jgi:DNA-binding transcriptional ArsR family regulator
MDAYGALADPTRRSIVEMLTSGEMEAGSIADRFPVSRPAISRHLRVLRESALVRFRKDGTKRLYRLDADALNEVTAWAEQMQAFWNDRLDALERHLDEDKERT